MSFVLLLFTVIAFAQFCGAQDNETEVKIRCLPLRDCPDIAYLVKNNNQQFVHEILKLSTCGYDSNQFPKVWCPMVKVPNCSTPDQKQGRCKAIQQCDAFKKLVEAPDELSVSMKVFIYKHKCNDPDNPRGFSVCCPKETVTPKPVTPQPVTPKPVTPKPVTPKPVTPKPGVDIITTDNGNLIPRPAEGECGQQLIYKIVGGKETEMDEHPWSTMLEYDNGDELVVGCGGSLISNRYVVTAAHCVDHSAVRHSGNLTHVILGEYETRNKTDCITRLGIKECADPPVKMQIEEVILHPQWYSKPSATINHDIALIRLAKPVEFTDYIKAICIPPSNLVLQESQKLEVVGWGQTEKGTTSTVKLKTQLPLFNRNQCVTKYKQDKGLNVGDGQICAGGELGKDSCTGDSGGPLVFISERPEYTAWFLAGVVSFGPNQPCGAKNYPGLYTYLPKYVDWIHKTVRA